MRRSTGHEALIFITNPPATGDADEASPFAVEEAEQLVFCCFFREVEERADFLKRLREVAAKPVEADSSDEMADEFDRAIAADDTEGAFFAAARWWVGAQRHVYHVYNLKLGYGPYRSSCIIAFDELDSAVIEANFATALSAIQSEQSRIVDGFGLGGFFGPNT